MLKDRMMSPEEQRRARRLVRFIEEQRANDNRRGGGKHRTRAEEMYLWTTLALIAMVGFIGGMLLLHG
jgi:hypothetical protein